MRNRAKCKLCLSIIESFHATDHVSCKCGEISVDGGDSLRCFARDWSNLLRVDDEGNEIIVKVKETTKPNRKELLDMLHEMIKSYEQLPPHVMTMPVTNYDLCASLLLVESIFRSEES